MKILFLSFYFPPDLSAGSFRSSSLVDALLLLLEDDMEIEVISTLPNRYSSFTSKASTFEISRGLTIHRIAIPRHDSGIFDQCRAFFAYVRGVLKLLADKDYDMIYATSSRLMTAALAAYISRKLGKPLYLDLRDIFVDTIKDILPYNLNFFIVPLFSIIERYTINTAGKVNLVSAGFLPYFQKIYVNQSFEFFTNGIDNEFLNAEPKQKFKNNSKQLTVVYAGNIGDGQGLHKIIPELASRFKKELLFKIIGDGSQCKKLLLEVKAFNCQNVILLPPVKREDLIKIYKEADILFIHLNDFESFTKVLPSKLFEYAASGKPIWAGVDGYAREFIRQKIENSAIFSPCIVDEAVSSFKNLKMVTNPRKKFTKEFSREKIMKNMARNIMVFGQNY